MTVLATVNGNGELLCPFILYAYMRSQGWMKNLPPGVLHAVTESSWMEQMETCCHQIYKKSPTTVINFAQRMLPLWTAITTATGKSGFRRAGIYPWDPTRNISKTLPFRRRLLDTATPEEQLPTGAPNPPSSPLPSTSTTPLPSTSNLSLSSYTQLASPRVARTPNRVDPAEGREWAPWPSRSPIPSSSSLAAGEANIFDESGQVEEAAPRIPEGACIGDANANELLMYRLMTLFYWTEKALQQDPRVSSDAESVAVEPRVDVGPPSKKKRKRSYKKK